MMQLADITTRASCTIRQALRGILSFTSEIREVNDG